MGLSFFIMLVIARQRSVDAVMGQQLLGMASVLRGYEVGFLEDAQPTQRYIFKVTDRGSNDIKYPSHPQHPSLRGWRMEDRESRSSLLYHLSSLLTSPNPSRSGNPGRWCVVRPWR